jgi:hypothetical protein
LVYFPGAAFFTGAILTLISVFLAFKYLSNSPHLTEPVSSKN